MRIAIDGAAAYGRDDNSHGGGIEHYTRSMIRFLGTHADESHALLVLLPHWAPDRAEQELRTDNPHVSFIRPKLPFVRGVSRHLALPAACRLRRADALFAPHGQLPWGWSGASVVTVHDVSIFDHPEWFPESVGQDFSKTKTVPRSLEHADAVITVSGFSKERLAERFPVAKGKTRVIYEGVEIPDVPMANKETNKDMILYLGTVEPRKNLGRAFAAFDGYLRKNRDQAATTRFVVAGRDGWKSEQIKEAIQQMNDAWREHAGGDVIERLGFVSTQEKWSLMKQASVFFFPSLEEGFGLPVLEAMAVGTPVITSNRGALSEVGGDAVFYVDPEDVSQMALTLAQCLLLPEGVEGLREEARERATRFTWERAAEQTWELLCDVAAREEAAE